MPRPIERRNSPIHGNGVFATGDIPAGVKVARYKGKLLTHKQADKLYGGGSETGHTFLFTLNDKYVIDANVDGNKARWINHSCDPNCQAVLVEDEGNPAGDKVIIESLRPIKAGEELTYNYGITLEEAHTARMKKIWACRCGSANCTGTMLQAKRKPKG
ncbi:MAG: SET domain-containing protein-lysine N-methyltransferase [Lysobacteraceae bacterium]